MQHHTVQQIDRGPRTGKWIYTGGNDHMGRYAECCADAWVAMLDTPVEQRDTSPVWDRIGHDTAAEAYAHMREVLLDRLKLDRGQLADWAGCRAPVGESRCDVPTKRVATIPPIHFDEPLCDEHRTRETVEAMWQGPGDWSGSW